MKKVILKKQDLKKFSKEIYEALSDSSLKQFKGGTTTFRCYRRTIYTESTYYRYGRHIIR